MAQAMEIVRWGTPEEIFKKMGTPTQVLKALCATLPFARMHLSDREQRKRSSALRAAYALWWREEQRIAMVLYTERPLMMLPDCRSCGIGTGNFCDDCTWPWCTTCEAGIETCPVCSLENYLDTTLDEFIASDDERFAANERARAA